MEIIQCGIHGFGETIGIDVDEFRVFWKLSFDQEHAQQVAYRLVVSTSKTFEAGGDVCYDSGRCESREQRNILCKPTGGFSSTTLHYWAVRIWDQEGNDAVSAVNEFYTSYTRSSRLLPPYSMNQTYVRLHLTVHTPLRQRSSSNETVDASHQSHIPNLV
jgi:hypothetical protein